MHDDNAPAEPREDDEALPVIEFESPGRFSVHNPDSHLPEPEVWEPAPFVLGQHTSLERFATKGQARAHAMALLQQARRSLCLYSSDLEPWLYHHSSVLEACTEFLLAHRHNRLRILLRDVTTVVKQGHRLMSLSRRLPSACQIRKLNPDHPNEDVTFLLADAKGFLLRPEPEQIAGYALYHDPARARQRQVQFDQAWEASLTDPDLRSFLL
ncbi:MAG: histone acetyltransferase HPA2 [Pseudomonadota bacterium]